MQVNMPTITIPATPEIKMGGVTAAFTPTIMKCALGGWFVVVPGKGMFGCTELREAIAFIEEQSFEALDEPRPEPMPQLTEHWHEPEPEPKRLTFSGTLHSIGSFLGTITSGFFVFLGVKAAA